MYDKHHIKHSFAKGTPKFLVNFTWTNNLSLDKPPLNHKIGGLPVDALLKGFNDKKLMNCAL